MKETYLMIPEKRISIAKSIVLKSSSNVDSSNVLGIAGFGSFWSKEINRKPLDIDLAVYVQNDAVFNELDKSTIVYPLVEQFGIEAEIHVITPYTVMVAHEAHNYKILLQDRTLIWGSMPDWLL